MRIPTDYEIAMELRAIEAEEIAKATRSPVSAKARKIEVVEIARERKEFEADTGGERIVKWLGAAAWFTAGVAVVVALALAVGFWGTR